MLTNIIICMVSTELLLLKNNSHFKKYPESALNNDDVWLPGSSLSEGGCLHTWE